MKILKTSAKQASLVLFLSVSVIGSFAHATETSEAEARLEALSYAPEGSNLDERFTQFEYESDDYAEHELNDSWLGMPAYSSNGKLVGYIEDAFLDQDGYVTQIIVGLNDNQGIVEIAGKYAELTDENVLFELSASQIAGIANKNRLVSLAE